jgi:hypothetical protein
MPRLGGRAAIAAGAALAVLGACSPKDNGTLLVVRVDTDLAVPGRIDTVEIRVVPERGDATTDTYKLTGRSALPATLGLRPKGDPNFGVEVTARGLLGLTVVVTQTAAVRFVPGEARELQLFLANDCVTGGGCQAPDVCVRGPSCVAKTAVAPLRPYTPGGQDAGTDLGGSDLGGGDAPTEAAGDRPADTAMDAPGDTGAPPADGSAPEGRPNPGTWVSVPGVPSTVTLSAIWPVSDRDVWVAGAMASGVVLRYDGTSWNPAPIPPGTPALYGLWGSGNGDLWAVGAAGTVLHFANNVWQSLRVPALPGAQPPTLTSIWGAQADDIWIVGSAGRIFHIDATGAITPDTSGVTAGLFAVGGSAQPTGTSDVWAVGASGTILHHTAGAWTLATQVPSQSILYGVWSDGPSDVWVAGDRTVLRWNGSSWRPISGAVDVSLAIWGSAENDVWTVGRPPVGGSAIARWDGVAFTNSADAPMTSLQTVRGTSTRSVWAAGAAGAIYHFQSR